MNFTVRAHWYPSTHFRIVSLIAKIKKNKRVKGLYVGRWSSVTRKVGGSAPFDLKEIEQWHPKMFLSLCVLRNFGPILIPLLKRDRIGVTRHWAIIIESIPYVLSIPYVFQYKNSIVFVSTTQRETTTHPSKL